MTDATKRCTKCGETKPVSEFHRDSGRKDGLYLWCKACNWIKQQEWRVKNPDKVKAAAKRFNDRHPERQKEWHKAWRNKNPEKMREYTRLSRERNPNYATQQLAASLKRQYGITVDDYTELLRKQGGVCAICGLPPAPGQRLCVDHDHQSLEVPGILRVRGLLHQKCNRTLGLFDDDPRWFAAAARYLRKK